MAYTPAGNLTTTSTIAHLATVYYDRQALDVLRKKFMFWELVDNRVLPKRNGKLIQFWRPTVFAANTVAKTEGQVGTSLQLTTETVSATVSQYADFITISDLLEETALDPALETVARELGYRGGLTADTLVRNEVDSVAGSIDVALLGGNLAVKDLADIRHLLAGVDVEPKKGPYFVALAHPYVTYDLVNDPAAGGFVDRSIRPGSKENERLFTMEDRGLVARIAGVEIWESTNVTQVSGTPNKWRVYFAGNEGLLAIDLAGTGPMRVRNPKSERFNVTVQRTSKDKSDPEGVIAGFASYNFKFVAKVADTSPYRLRKIDSPSSIVA